MPAREPLELRLNRRLKWIDDCLVWTGSINSCGYGSIGTGDGKTDNAHRVYWKLNRGPIPNGLYVLHKCPAYRKTCVTHTYLGTHGDNMRDAARDGRFPGGGFFFDWTGKKRLGGKHGKLAR